MSNDLIERLTKWRDMRIGEPLPETVNNWGVEISAVCGDAIKEIERLGLLSAEKDIKQYESYPSFREVKDGLYPSMADLTTRVKP